ncbi:MAG TPA: 16S rRNA (cytidine(1402)-2'-O)-methyltransferase [Acidimicrobiia bacterium]
MPLVLIGTPIGNLGDLSPRVVDVLKTADVIACEDTRRTRKLLAHAGIASAGRLRALHAHNEDEQAERVVDEVRAGRTVAYATDAGMPGISDPGARLVRACRAAGLAVEVVPGPSAALAALVLSGFTADRFVFEGFLPRKGAERRARLEAIARDERTAVVFEAPNRVRATLDDLLAVCEGDRLVCVARELTKLHEEVLVAPLSDAAGVARFGEPRGEHVVVLEGRTVDAIPVTDETIAASVEDALGRGLSARDAAAEVAATLGVPKRRAYELAVTLRRR